MDPSGVNEVVFPFTRKVGGGGTIRRFQPPTVPTTTHFSPLPSNATAASIGGKDKNKSFRPPRPAAVQKVLLKPKHTLPYRCPKSGEEEEEEEEKLLAAQIHLHFLAIHSHNNRRLSLSSD